jgi:hypothetical protein
VYKVYGPRKEPGLGFSFFGRHHSVRPGRAKMGKLLEKAKPLVRLTQNRCNYLRFFRRSKRIRLQFFMEEPVEKILFGCLATAKNIPGAFW